MALNVIDLTGATWISPEGHTVRANGDIQLFAWIVLDGVFAVRKLL